MKVIDKKAALELVNDPHNQYHKIVKEFLITAPTIDAAPVKHGSWKYGYNPDVGILCYFCSACGKEAYWDTDYGQQRFDFCPKCGADMRGGDEN